MRPHAEFRCQTGSQRIRAITSFIIHYFCRQVHDLFLGHLSGKPVIHRQVDWICKYWPTFPSTNRLLDDCLGDFSSTVERMRIGRSPSYP